MDKLFYWKSYDAPIHCIDRITNKPLQITGEWICDHPLVEKIWLTGASDGKEDGIMIMHTNVLMKNGERHHFVDDFKHVEVNKFLSELK